MGWEYSEKTKQLFMDAVHGKPGSHMGEIENPDGLGEHGSIACGDALRFTFRVDRDADDPTKDVIVEAKYLTFGCTSAIAASEALCAIIEGQGLTPIEALKITNQDIVDFLEGLPEQKIHCSVMGAEALEAAVFNWAQKRGVNLNELGIDVKHEEQEEGRIVCKCFSLSEPYIKRKIKELGLRSIADITGAIKAGGACMSCHHAPGGLQDLLNEVWAEEKPSPRSTSSPSGSLEVLPSRADLGTPGEEELSSKRSSTATAETEEELSPYQRGKKIEQVIEEYIRPMLHRDGGDLEILDIKDRAVYVQLKGACAGCAGATQTLHYMVEKNLKDLVDERIRVIQV
jgi:NifU-like protein